MTETQKLIATEVVKERMKRISAETLLKKEWPSFLASDLKKNIEQSNAIEKVLSRVLKSVCEVETEETPKKYVYRSIIDGSVNAMDREDALLDDAYERTDDKYLPSGRMMACYRKEVV